MAIASVFTEGPYSTKEDHTRHHFLVLNRPPKPLLLVYPTEPGNYPLLIFFHGFMLRNDNYKEGLFKHIASHGYIVVAPQMYGMLDMKLDAIQEVKDAETLTEWLPKGLSEYLPQAVHPEFEKMVVAGHSRGGKVAFGAALGKGLSFSLPYSGVIGVDPVDGSRAGFQIEPKILTFKDDSLEQGIPALVVGSGTPHQPMSPDGLNHKNFFKECCAPAYHFVAETCRHMDFLDHNVLIDWLAAAMGEACQEEAVRKRIRSFAGGIMVAFLNGCVKGDYDDLKGVLAEPSLAPVKIDVADKEKVGILSRL